MLLIYRKALDVVKENFEQIMVENQDFLGNDDKVKKLLPLIKDEKLRAEVYQNFKSCTTSVQRWSALQSCLNSANLKAFKNKRNMTKEEIMLQYSYPRLDANVSIAVNHLLKSPFCVHPKTGRVCVPFLAKHVDEFDPFEVPTVLKLRDEINEHDKNERNETKSQEEKVSDSDAKEENGKIKDYKKTSLKMHINIFKIFIKDMNSEWCKEKVDKKEQTMQY